MFSLPDTEGHEAVKTGGGEYQWDESKSHRHLGPHTEEEHRPVHMQVGRFHLERGSAGCSTLQTTAKREWSAQASRICPPGPALRIFVDPTVDC